MVILRHRTMWIPIVICLSWFVKLKNLSVLVQNVRVERNRYLTERKSCFALDVFAWCWPLSIVRSSSCSDVWTVQNDQKLMVLSWNLYLGSSKACHTTCWWYFLVTRPRFKNVLFRCQFKWLINKQYVQIFLIVHVELKIFFGFWLFEI